MNDYARLLFDTSSFVPRKQCGNWSDELRMLHNASDILIWLAYLSIPLALLTVVRRLRELPFRGVFVLFGVFILSCGFTHFMDVVMFEVPMYRLAGWLKLLTAVVSWATVLVLIPTLPKVFAYADAVGSRETPVPTSDTPEPRGREYLIGLLTAATVLTVRAMLDRIPEVIRGDHLLVLPLLGVVFVAWRGGFGPALLTLLVSMAGIVYFFVEPTGSVLISSTGDQFAVGLFLFSGFAAAMLGESQRVARLKEKRARHAERLATERLAASENRMRTFLDSSPSAQFVKDADGCYLTANSAFAALVGCPAADIVGRTDQQLFNAGHADRLRRQDEEVQDKKVPLRWEDRFSLDGKKYSILTSKFPLPDGTTGGVMTDFTYRRKAEKALRASASRFRQLADAMPQIVWVTKPNGQHQFFNSRWYAYTGQTRAQSHGWGWVTPLHPEDKERAEAAWNTATATGGKYEIEYRFRRADGEYRWFLGRAEPVRDAAGRITRWFGTCTDIDDRKRDTDHLARTAVALRESEATLRAFYDNSPLCMGVVELTADADVRHLYDNPATCRFFGVPANSTAGQRATDLGTPPEVAAVWAERYRESAKTGGAVRFSHTVGSGPDLRWLSASVSPLPTPPDARPRFCYVAEDVTDSRRAEAALRDSELRYRLVSDAANDAIWDWNLVTNQVTWNDGLRRSLGYDPMEVDPDAGWWVAHIHPDDRERVLHDIHAVIDGTEEDWHGEYRYRKADGSYATVFDRGRVLRADGQPVRMVGSMLDMTDRLRIEREAKEAAERFQAMADSIPQLAWMTEPDGHIFWYNRQWYEFTGTTLEQMQGWGWQSVHDPAELPRIVAKWKQYLAAGEPWEDIFPLRRHDGIFRQFLSRARPLRDDAGRIVRWFGTNTDITDRLELEDRLRDAASDFRQLTEGLPQLVWACTPSGECEYLSRQWVEYTGRSAEEQMPYGWADALHPGDQDAVMVAWRRAVAGLGTYDLEYRLRRADGEYRWFRVQAIPLTDAAGRVTRWVGTSTNVHEQKQNEDALRASEARFRLLTETVPNPVWNVDAEGTVTYLNRRWLDCTGTSVRSVRDDGWRQVLHPDDADRVVQGWDEALRTAPEQHTDEFRIRHRDGAYRWYVLAAVPLRRADGTVDQWIGAMADVDDQKREAERLEGLVADRTADLRRQQEFLDAILESITDGIVACDADGRLTLFNRATREFHGLPAEPLAADRWADRFSLFRADGVTLLPTDEIPLARAFAGERVRDAEIVIAPAGAPPRRLLAAGQPLADAAGRRLGAVVSMRDVTEERRLRDRERAVTVELRRSNQELEKFASVASHDLQEPLRKIQAFGDRLRQKHRPELTDPARDYLDRMLASAARMRTLIDDLLAFARVTTKAQPFAPVKLADVVRGVVSDLEFLIARTSGRVEVGPLPTLHADPTQMRQVFQNLIANGLKFHRAEVPPVVTVTAVGLGSVPADADPPPLPGAGWRFTVTDNGIGFEQQYADRIFELFQRLHGRTEYEGTGIGLAVCKKIVDRHGGIISARGFPEIGATFTFDLPAQSGSPQPVER